MYQMEKSFEVDAVAVLVPVAAPIDAAVVSVSGEAVGRNADKRRRNSFG